jgi:ParB-like chromosome segregation protein Spo0J
MAKRRRLTPFGTGTEAEDQAEIPVTSVSLVRPPIADMAGAAAATAAMEEMAASLRQARESGRLVLSLPLDQIEAGYLVRDRIATDPDEMSALVESLRARGQQTPIEVTLIGPDRYGLISGWRRLTALRQLAAENPDFGSVLALLRKPDQASDAYIAMVEENEIRVGLSFYERARIAAKAVEVGVYPDDRAALRALFASASRAKRSKIGSFLTVVRALDGVLHFPESIGERLGLQLAQGLETDPGLATRLAQALADPAPDAGAEQARIQQALTPRKAAAEVTIPPIEPISGLKVIQHPAGRMILEGPRLDADLAARLIDWLKAQG